MDREFSEEDVRKAIEGVKHPAIDRTLLELGIVKGIEVTGGRVKVTFAFPFPNIPIKDMLIESIRAPITGLGLEMEEEIVVMTPDELQRFLEMEREGWVGGV